MREIKFRAWDRINKHWSTAPWFQCQTKDFPVFGYDFQGVGCENEWDLDIQQFTGLKDKNGLQEVYEGDIVQEFGGIGEGEVKFGRFNVGALCHGEQTIFGWFYQKDHGGTNMLHSELIVIGNIYENPELL